MWFVAFLLLINTNERVNEGLDGSYFKTEATSNVLFKRKLMGLEEKWLIYHF